MTLLYLIYLQSYITSAWHCGPNPIQMRLNYCNKIVKYSIRAVSMLRMYPANSFSLAMVLYIAKVVTIVKFMKKFCNIAITNIQCAQIYYTI